MSRSPLFLLPILAIAISLFLGLERYIYHFISWLTPRKWKHRRLMHLPAFLLCAASFQPFSAYGITLLHFWILSMLTECALALLRKAGISVPVSKATVLLPLLITVIVIGWGYYNIAHPIQTSYTLHTSKPIRASGWRAALITDSHYDTIQNPIHLRNAIADINAQRPDFVVLGGDIVEEGTSRERMQEVFQILSQLDAPTYYIYGNHDQQNYSRNPAYSHQELAEAIEGAGISILEDSSASVNDDILLYGRIDSSIPKRDALPDLSDSNRYVIIADHQPNSWRESAASGADLQLSGHTHAGQIWPIGSFLELAGGLSYGYYNRDGIVAIVSSGFAGWGFPLRTSQRCEYVIIDILP